MSREIYGRIYCITNLTNGKRYVGKTKRSLEHRWRRHCKDCEENSTAIQRAITKYGVAGFSIRQLATAETLLRLNDLERFWIAKLGTMVPLGYNLTAGGDGGGSHPVTRAKQRLATKVLWASKTFRAARRVQHKEIWKDPRHKAKVTEGQKRARDKMSEAAKRHWSNPLTRRLMLKGQRRGNTAEWRNRLAEISKAQWRNPEGRKRLLAGMAKKTLPLDFSETMRKSSLRMWRSPAFRVKVLAGRKRYKQRLALQA